MSIPASGIERASSNPQVIIDLARNHLEGKENLSVHYRDQEVEIETGHAQLFIDCFSYAIENPEKNLDGYFERNTHLNAIAVGYLGFAAGVQSRGLETIARSIVQEGVNYTDSMQSFWDTPIMSFLLAHSSTSGAQDARFYARAVQEYFVVNNILPVGYRAPEERR